MLDKSKVQLPSICNELFIQTFPQSPLQDVVKVDELSLAGAVFCGVVVVLDIHVPAETGQPLDLLEGQSADAR